MGARVWMVVSVLAAGALAGCSQAEASLRRDGESDEEFASRVVHDENATPAEIAAAGEEIDTDEFEGRTVTTYRLADPGDGGETPPRYAWRQRDGDGKLLGEAKTRYSMTVSVFPDGFLILNGGSPRLQHLDNDGTVRTVPVGKARPTRAGDTVVVRGGLLYAEGDNERSIAYRPGTGGAAGTAALLPQAPVRSRFGRVIQEDALTTDGTLWVRHPEEDPRKDPAEVLWSADGRVPWRTSRLPIPATSFGLGPLTAIGDRVYLFSARGWIGGGERIESLWVADRGGEWREIPLAGIPRRKGDDVVVVALTADGRLSVRIESGAYVQDGNRFVPLPAG